MSDTAGAQLHPALDQRHLDAVIDKGQQPDADGYSAFESAELEQLLREQEVTAITAAGLATDCCVLNTARDALREGFAVTVDTSVTRAVDVTPGDGERAVAELRGLGANVTDLRPRLVDIVGSRASRNGGTGASGRGASTAPVQRILSGRFELISGSGDPGRASDLGVLT
ncbi:MAG: isochorismatase family protein [Solirubrobacteraceae bacterium]